MSVCVELIICDRSICGSDVFYKFTTSAGSGKRKRQLNAQTSDGRHICRNEKLQQGVKKSSDPAVSPAGLLDDPDVGHSG
jgi:hypothetical protein